MNESNHVIKPKAEDCRMNPTECREMFNLVKDMHNTLCGNNEMRSIGLIKRVEDVEKKVSLVRYVFM